MILSLVSSHVNESFLSYSSNIFNNAFYSYSTFLSLIYSRFSFVITFFSWLYKSVSKHRKFRSILDYLSYSVQSQNIFALNSIRYVSSIISYSIVIPSGKVLVLWLSLWVIVCKLYVFPSIWNWSLSVTLISWFLELNTLLSSVILYLSVYILISSGSPNSSLYTTKTVIF